MNSVWLAKFQFYTGQLSSVVARVQVLLDELEEFCEQCGPMCICEEVA